MHIQSYQIHNVLSVYRRQLSLNNATQPVESDSQKPEKDAVTISIEGKKQAIMEKVAASVIEKITQLPPQQREGELESGAPLPQPSDIDWQMLQREHTFTFNTIVGDNQKLTRSITIDDSQVLMNRLDELAKAAVNQTAD